MVHFLETMSRRSNPGLGRDFYFFGKFRSKILAARSEREHPGSFIIARKGYYYVLKDKVRRNPEEPRIRFNWGFWDRRNQGARIRPHPLPKDKFYRAGYEYGGYTTYANDTSSDNAWKDFRKIKNPEWKAPLTKRKKKRLGVLYQKAFRKFSRENPRGVLIYGRILKIFARKTQGPYKGQDFVHTFKPGAVMIGMPDGSLRISHD